MADFSWLNMLSPWQWALLACVPPAIVALYFLKLKRRPLEVPSTYLWHKSIEDLRVNSIWQRLRQSLLLFLQLLLVALAALALLGPSWQGSKLLGNRFVFLIDNSASMAASDVEPTRLEEAKRRVLELIDNDMKSGDVAMVISFADGAEVVEPFTDNTQLLKDKVRQIRQTNMTSSLGQALILASGLANPGRSAFDVTDTKVAESLPATMYIFSDGRFPDVSNFSLGKLGAVYVPIGSPSAENLAITAMSAEFSESGGERLQVFVRVENFGPAETAADVELFVSGSSFDVRPLVVQPGQVAGVTFDLNAVEEGILEARLSRGGALRLDDIAWCPVNRPRPVKLLLVTPGNEALELAIQELAEDLADVEVEAPAMLETNRYRERATARAWDLIVYDQCAPAQMPEANTLWIGRLPPAGGWSAGEPAAGPQIIDVQVNHPLTQLLDLSNVAFATAMPLKLPPGGQGLIETQLGPVYGVAPRDHFEDAVLSAEIVGRNDQGEWTANTDWPIRQSFPVFLLNAMKYLGGERVSLASGAAGSVQPGKPVVLRLDPSAEPARVRPPGQPDILLPRPQGSTATFTQTDALGIYEVYSGKQLIRRFAVNLFDALESELPPRPALALGEVKVAAQSSWQSSRRHAWKPLIMAALAVLLAEWYIYNRRVYV